MNEYLITVEQKATIRRTALVSIVAKDEAAAEAAAFANARSLFVAEKYNIPIHLDDSVERFETKASRIIDGQYEYSTKILGEDVPTRRSEVIDIT